MMMRSAALSILALLLLAGLFADAAHAEQEELLDQARERVAEAMPFVVQANDVDLDMSRRKAPRREAFDRLKRARELYDKYLDANPALEEKLDKEYVEMMVLLHGIKKDSSVGEFDKEHDSPDPPPPTTSPPVPREPGEPHAPSLQARLLAIQEFEKSDRGDLPEIQRRYARLMADFPDPALPEYALAADRMGKVIVRIRTVFRQSTKRDYDSLAGPDTKDEARIVNRLEPDLRSNEVAVRRRAARLLATTRLRLAPYHLASYVADADAETATLCRDGLVGIGGHSTGKALVAHCFERVPNERRIAAMTVFHALVELGELEAASQSRFIGKFTLLSANPISEQAFALLVSMGKRGGPGLMIAVLESTDVDKQARAIAKVAEVRYYRGTPDLVSRFLVEPKSDTAAAQLHNAASKAIRAMGAPTVQYLIEPLGGPAGRGTARVASEITGLVITIDDREKLGDWWASHKPKDSD